MNQATANTSGFFFPLDYYQHKAIFADMSVLANGHVNPKPTTADRQAGQAEQARRSNGRALRQLFDTRDNLHHRLMSEEMTPAHAAQVARAHKEVVQQIMDIQGHGKPRPVPARNDPGAKPRKAQVSTGPLPDKPDA